MQSLFRCYCITYNCVFNHNSNNNNGFNIENLHFCRPPTPLPGLM